MDSGSDDATPEASADDASDTGLQQALPEIECYLHLLVLIVLLDSKQLDRVCYFNLFGRLPFAGFL